MPRRDIFAAYPAFAPLPVERLTVGGPRDVVAVHVAGTLGRDRPPLVCLAGYNRNMADFTELVPRFQRQMGEDWPVVLLDLRGRGRSSDRADPTGYASTADARDVNEAMRALGIDSAVLLGQGHGGQVAMALAGQRPGLLAAAILVDAGPVVSPHNLVRLNRNSRTLGASRGAGGLTIMLRRMLAVDYPHADNPALDRLAARTHCIAADGRAVPLFDAALIERLKDISLDDVLLPQWPFFDRLAHAPLLLVRTALTDQLPEEVFAEMQRRRPDAASLTISRQGSPALFDTDAAIEAIAGFVRLAAPAIERQARRA